MGEKRKEEEKRKKTNPFSYASRKIERSMANVNRRKSRIEINPTQSMITIRFISFFRHGSFCGIMAIPNPFNGVGSRASWAK